MSINLENRNLPLLLSQARETVISHFRPILNCFDLTEQQWRIIRILGEEGKMEPKEICETCQILSPSMAGILKRMEDMKLIKRQPVATDRRRVTIHLTAKSKKIILQMTPLIDQQYSQLKEAYGEQLITQLYQSLDDIIALRDLDVKQVTLPKRKR